LSAIAKERKLLRKIITYRELTDLFDFFAKLHIISPSAEAVDLFNGFRKSSIKIGTMDLKVASIASTALLLTGNRRDYGKVSGLRFEYRLE
jgi:hypothetical protein